MAWGNIAEWQARHDPRYLAKMDGLRAQVEAQYRLQELNHGRQLELARYQADEAAGRERERNATSLEVERLRGQNRLAELEAELDGRMRVIGAESQVLSTQKLLDEEIASRSSFRDQLEQRSQLRNEVFKMLAGAIIQEKLAQKQHRRDLEKLEFESSQRRADAYLQNAYAYLMKTEETKGKAAAEQAIDDLLAQWERGA